MARFSLINQIQPEQPKSWADQLFLTFDIDWSCDGVLNEVIDWVEEADVPATWFVTHATPVLERLCRNPKFELGIHPNFDFLLNGDFRKGSNMTEVVERLMEVVPEAKSVRCHALTQSTRLLNVFEKFGLTHECNTLVPAQTGISLRPWRLWTGMIKAPHFWEDDVDYLYPNSKPVSQLQLIEGLKVFCFHPTNLFINASSPGDYQQCKPIYSDFSALRKLWESNRAKKGERQSFSELIGLR